MELDYEKLGFKCGLECHQQLEGKKLFCNCPTLNSDKEPDIKVKRRLRAVAGETGIVDVAAEFEMSKKKNFVYESSSEDTCLVEYDEEPPHAINMKALETAIKIALLLNAKIVDEIQVMRKTVVDGSNVSGFQRTALVAVDGYVETEREKVRIPTICLEEEAAQKMGEDENSVKYRLGRLGIPLIEIATDASIKNAEHAKEVASHIGMVLRSADNVKRGLGTIRQDVNISIEKGARTEIKGFQELKSIPKVIEYEVKRQLDAINQGEKLSKEVRKAEPDFTTSFLRPLPGAARLYPETDVLPVKISMEYIEEMKKSLPRLITERFEEFEKKYELQIGMGKELVGTGFEQLVKSLKIEPITIAKTIINTPSPIKKKLETKDFKEILEYYSDGKIAKEAIAELLEKKALGGKIDLSQFASVSEENLKKELKKIVEEKPGLNISAYMGLAMAKYRGKVDGKIVMDILKKILSV